MNQITLEQIQELDPTAKLMSGGYLLMTCPWHDDAKQSLLVYPDGWWHCIGECLTSGPNYKLYAELSAPGTTRRGSRDIPTGRPPILPTSPDEVIALVELAHGSIKRNSSFRWYAEMRGIEGRIEPCELGWYEGWLVLPIKSKEDHLEGLILRAGPQAEKLTGMRFTQPAGQRAMPYCPDWSLLSRTKEPLYVVFGMIDALTLSELRLPVITTTGGAKSFKAEWLDEWRAPIIVVPDASEEPQAFALLKNLDWRGKIKQLKYPNDYKDPNDYLRNGKGEMLLKELVSG